MKVKATRKASAPPDPIWWSAAIALAFLALVCWHLGIPGKIYFDEVHYVPAARKLLALLPANPEHPLFGKEVIAAGIWALGDAPWGWRLPCALLGALGLFAFGRALWWTSGRRFAALAGMVFLASDFGWFIQSRIAMLDMVMASLAMVALWQVAAAVALPDGTPPARRRWRLALAGVCIGLAMGAKWSVLPIAALVGLGFVFARIAYAGRRFLADDNSQPCPGIALMEAVFWLGSVPLLVYFATFAPAFFYHNDPIAPTGLVNWHRYMVALQDSVTTHHPYQSLWYQWLINYRPIWYLYEEVDGAQRGILMLGNPFTMLAGLPALAWCLWAGFWRGRRDALAVIALYAATLALWMVPGKPIQFYYHYLLPGSFLMAALALALDDLWRRAAPWRWGASAALALSVAMFGWFYPIISGAALHHGKASFAEWMWLDSWR